METEEFKQQAGELISQLEGIISKLTDIDQNIVLSSSLNEFKIVVDDMKCKNAESNFMTANNGESEWMIDDVIYVAIPNKNHSCSGCMRSGKMCIMLPDCDLDFDEPIIYINKPL